MMLNEAMGKLQQDPLFAVVTAIGALAAVILLMIAVLPFSSAALRLKKLERQDKNKIIADAATSRFHPRLGHRRRRHRIDSQVKYRSLSSKRELKINRNNSNTSSSSSFEKEQNTTTTSVREATVGDRIAWEEEKMSRKQFGGFSIYGHDAQSESNEFCVECSSGTSLTSSSGLPTGFDAIQCVSELSDLTGSDHALSLLQHLCQEFEPVVRARGWTVLKVKELCCCSEVTKPSNVVGFCVSPGNARTAISISIRLRPHGFCNEFRFYPYRDLVKTMAHELAHIVFHQHNNAFFKLMTAILKERDGSRVLEGTKLDVISFPLTSGQRLGTRIGNSSVIGYRELKKLTANAAMKRQLGKQ